jgi:hypothetical protein
MEIKAEIDRQSHQVDENKGQWSTIGTKATRLLKTNETVIKVVARCSIT